MCIRDSNPSFNTITFVTSTSRSEYHGGTFQLRRNFKNGYTVQGAYTFGRAMNDTDQAVGSTATQDAANLRGEWALASYDAPQKLALIGLWEMPFFKSRAGLTRKLLGGWQLAGSAILQSGTPLNITNGATYPTGDFNADGAGGDRPNTPTGSIQTGGWTNQQYLTGIFLASDFPRPVAGQNGTLVRNAFRGPGYADVSLSLSKKFEVTPKVSAEVRIDAFNALNRVNLSDPTTDLSSTNFGKSTTQLNPRAFQTGLRLRF